MDTINKSIALGKQQGVSEFYSRLNLETVKMIDNLPSMTTCEVYKQWADLMWNIYRDITAREEENLK